MEKRGINATSMPKVTTKPRAAVQREVSLKKILGKAEKKTDLH